MSWIIAWLYSKFYLALTIGKSFLPFGSEVHPPNPPPPSSPKYLSLTPYLYLLPFPPLLYFINPFVPGYCGGWTFRSAESHKVYQGGSMLFDHRLSLMHFIQDFLWMSYIGFTLFRCPNHLIFCLFICCTGGKLSMFLIFSLLIYWPAWFCWWPCVNIPFHRW